MQIDDNKWFESLSQVALAFFGGLIGALMRKEASTWQTAMLGALGAGFVGLLVAKLCHAGGISDDLTFVFVGVSGWLGAQRTIDYLERLIESKLGVRIEPETRERSEETNSYTNPIENAPTMENADERTDHDGR